MSIQGNTPKTRAKSLQSPAGKEVMTHTEAACTPDRAIRAFVKAGIGASTAALTLVCAGFGYCMIVNHLADRKSDTYVSKSDALDMLKKQLDAKTTVGGKMLDIYVSRIEALYDKVTGSAKKFAPFIASLAQEANEDKLVGNVSKWLSDDFGVTSLNQLNTKLGFATGREPAGGQTDAEKATAAPVRLATAITNVEKMVKSGSVPEKAVVQALSQSVSDPLALARASVDRYAKADNADTDALLSLITFCQKQIDVILARAEGEPKTKARTNGRKRAVKAPAIAPV